MVKRKGLGKGLGALIPENLDSNLEKNKKEGEFSQDQVQMISVDLITTSENNPRKNFDKEAINSLAESIKNYGILQPLVLIKENEIYRIVAGERRYRAAKKAGLSKIPAFIKNLSEKDKNIISIVENIQREDLNAYEEAQAYNNIMREYNITQQELATILGKSRTYIANIVRLLNLDELSISELEKGNITSSQARSLLSIKDLSKRKVYLDKLLNKEVTVNEIEKKSRKKHKVKNVYIRDLEERFTEYLGNKVGINKSKNKWTMKIEFSNEEDLENFISNFDLGD